jgi:hypothetical protein
VVFLAHRHAAAGQDQVVRRRRAAQGIDRGVQAVGHDAQVGHLAAQALQQRTQK